jgi:hypothetical protein
VTQKGDVLANDRTYAMRAACDCGTCVVEAKQPPKVRFNCHCTLCQAFTGDAYSDMMVVPASRAVVKNEDWINYKKYKKFRFPPPNLSRGRCRKCGKPFIETWGFGRNHVLLFVRAARFERPELLPALEAHMFYEHRVRDIDDGIPKHEGYFASEWAMAKMIVHAMSNGPEF